MRSNKIPRVVQVVLSLAPGGTERLVLELVRRSAPEIAMAVCCLDIAGAWGEELRNEGVNVEALERRAGFRPMLGRRVAEVASRHGANVIHCHQYSSFVYGSLARLWRSSMKIVFTEHGRLSDAPPSAKRRIANRVLSLAPHQVFAVSADLKRHIVAEGFAETQVGVIYNGIDIGPPLDQAARRCVREALGIPIETLIICTVARLDPVKNLETLINAVTLLNREIPATLVVVGDGPERQNLEALNARGGTAGVVRFLGHRDDARDLMAGCDVYANSSISEGISLTILEAMAAGLPVVATAVGGTPEIIDASCGRLVPARNPEAMCTALADLARDHHTRAALGRASRTRVEARFTLERMVSEYRDAYYRAAA